MQFLTGVQDERRPSARIASARGCVEQGMCPLDHGVEHLAGACRESMLKNVRLHREIMEAWAEHGEKAVGEGDAD